MKKIYILLPVLLVACLSSFAQRTADLGFGFGVTNYLGDLGNSKYISLAPRPGVTVTFRNFLNNPEKSNKLYRSLSIEGRLSYQRIGYDETAPIGNQKGNELRNYLRGLSFKNDLLGLSTNFTYTFYRNRNLPLYKQKFCFFIYAGVGAFYGSPKADLFNGGINLANRYYYWSDGTVRDAAEHSGKGKEIEKDGVYETDLHDWMTEGQGYEKESNSKLPYHLVNIGFPSGLGVRFGYNKNVTVSAEFSYYYFLTDYLDDVSGRYATYDEIAASFRGDYEKQEIAKYISDPSGRGTNGYVGKATSPRGNPKKNDAYVFASIEIAYKLILKNKSVFGQWSRN